MANKKSKPTKNKGLVVAHYNRAGLIREDTIQTLQALVKLFDKIIFVTTNLNSSEIPKIPKGVDVHVRENIGYDFYSYRLGMLELIQKHPGMQITIMNTSFVVLDVKKFTEKYFIENPTSKNSDCHGLVKSNEITPHLQSFLITFSKKCTTNKFFIDWWKKMTPLNIRHQVILNYEIGLSKLLLELGLKMTSTYEYHEINAIQNPTHGAYLDLMNQTGIIKIEVFKTNPYKLNLNPILDLARSNQYVKNTILQGLEN